MCPGSEGGSEGHEPRRHQRACQIERVQPDQTGNAESLELATAPKAKLISMGNDEAAEDEEEIDRQIGPAKQWTPIDCRRVPQENGKGGDSP